MYTQICALYKVLDGISIHQHVSVIYFTITIRNVTLATENNIATSDVFISFIHSFIHSFIQQTTFNLRNILIYPVCLSHKNII